MADASLASRFTAMFIGYSALVVLLLGVMSIWASEQLERTVLDGLVVNEIKYYKAVFSSSPANQAQNSNATAWLHRKDQPADKIPLPLRKMSPGMHEDFTALGRPEDLFIADTELGRMYIVLDGKLIDQREAEFMYMLIGYSIFLLLLSAVIAKFASRWLTGPIQKLSDELSTFEPGSSQHHLSGDYRGPEVQLLATVIRSYQSRAEEFIAREQRLTSLISHELRNPLAIISGSADVLQLRHGANSPDRPPIDRIKNSAITMAADIDALLLLAREKAQPDQAALCCLRSTAARVVDSYQDQLKAKSMTLTQEISTNVELPVPPALFAMLLSNLMRNAIRHSQARSLHLTLNSQQLSLTDTGKGISASELTTITHASVRLSDSGGGAGLGLYIVDQICNRMGWKLAIFSQEKVGTEVRVEFYSNAE